MKKEVSIFPICEYCGVAYDVGTNSCTSAWCSKPSVEQPTIIYKEKIVDRVIDHYIDNAPELKPKRKNYYYKNLDPSMGRWVSIVSRSKKKGYECNVTHEDIVNIISKPCVYCLSSDRIEVDRMDSSKGYTKDNIAPACHRCNTIKSNVVSYNEMMFIADYLGWRING